MADVEPRDIESTRRWADFYRSRGLNPLPSDPARKKPLVRFSHLWESRVDMSVFNRFATSNLQVMTGRFWRLLAIDLDGIAAREWFGRRFPDVRTWKIRSGGDGLHLWFRLPADTAKPLPRAVLWRGDGPHSAVERLCDRSLVIAPPSIHPRTGSRYKFIDKYNSPATLPFPAECPPWILRLEPIRDESAAPIANSGPRIRREGSARADDVLRSIPDKRSLAASWGLRLAGSAPNHAGWIPCRAIGREDRHPSASFSPATGCYWEPGQRPIGLFTLGVRLGIYADFASAVNDLHLRCNTSTKREPA